MLELPFFAMTRNQTLELLNSFTEAFDEQFKGQAVAPLDDPDAVSVCFDYTEPAESILFRQHTWISLSQKKTLGEKIEAAKEIDATILRIWWKTFLLEENLTHEMSEYRNALKCELRLLRLIEANVTKRWDF